MEGNKISARMYTSMLGLEMNLQPQNPQQNLLKQPQIIGFSQQQQQQIEQQQTQLSMKQPTYSYTNNNNNNSQKPKTQTTHFTTNSDEEEPNGSNDHENNNHTSDLKRKNHNNTNENSNSNSVGVSPWQRMKWTDNMVRLLIMAVYYIGDDFGGSELGSEKKKPGCGNGGGGGGALQKKGKWKSVSKAMMEKGFYVSPQQCEDKFNDLNKRYKRVNDILGKGTACKVVENQSLLETMVLEPKMKEEVRKLLNSKHLFFREMCAYHNSCGHVGGGNTGGDTVTVAAVTVAPGQQTQQQLPQMQLSPCLHTGQMQQHSSMDDDDENEDDDEDDDEDEEDEEEDVDNDHNDGNNNNNNNNNSGRKKARTMKGLLLSNWGGEVMRMLEDRSKSLWEKKQWMMTQMVELEENGMKIQGEALEFEKERLKWMKFCGKKEREMERMKIDNEKKRLDNERMLLLLRKKEMEFLFLERQKVPFN